MSGFYNEVREQRIRIFEDTKNHYETNGNLRNAIAKSIQAQFFVGEDDTLAENPTFSRDEGEIRKTEKERAAKILVSQKRSLEAASAYRGKKVCVHNFASATNPGGGVTKGSSAQEEAICRCSTLYPCLNANNVWRAFYKNHREKLQNGRLDAAYNDDCIYTPDVIVFKSDADEPMLLPEKNWYPVDVITCAAPNLRERPSNSMNPGSGDVRVRITQAGLRTLHIKRARRIMEIAKRQGVQVLILGAFGCGAFQNPPQVVAEAYKEALKDYRFSFETVEFAVYCPPGRMENYDAFCCSLRK